MSGSNFVAWCWRYWPTVNWKKSLRHWPAHWPITGVSSGKESKSVGVSSIYNANRNRVLVGNEHQKWRVCKAFTFKDAAQFEVLIYVCTASKRNPCHSFCGLVRAKISSTYPSICLFNSRVMLLLSRYKWFRGRTSWLISVRFSSAHT